MKRIVSFILSIIVLLSSLSLVAFAEGGDQTSDPVLTPDVAVIEDQAGKGTAFATGESKKNPAANINDDDAATFWTASGEEFGIDFTKNVNIKVYTVSVLLSNAEGTYKLQYFRNNRWVDEKTLTGEDITPVDGAEGQYRLDYTFEEPVITQQVRIVCGSDLADLKVYDMDVMGTYLPNVGTRGEAYATSFKHFDWTPPHTFINGKDFDEDWHGWEPQYPEVAAGAATSGGFGGEHVGVKFTNREYYKINQITFYLSMHNSSANPKMGYQDVVYTVEALVEGEWILVAQFKDSDCVPRDYKDYAEAMANDRSNYHIASFYTITLDTVLNTNNIRVSVSEFAKNYNGDQSLVFPYIYEMRVYAEEGEIPDIELPEGAVLSTNAAANSYPYASSSATNLYPFLSIDGDQKTGWQVKDLTAGQIFGTRFDKTYTINDFTLELNAADFSAAFKIEAKVNGEWVKLADGNVSDCYAELPEGETFIAQTHTYEFAPVEADEIRVVFTDALAKAVQINEIGANIVSSMTNVVNGGFVAAPKLNASNKYSGFELSKKEIINNITVDFGEPSEDNKFFIQAFVDGIWTTVFTGDNVRNTDGIFDVYTETDAVRIIYQNEATAPSVNSFKITTVNYSGDVSSYTTVNIPCAVKGNVTLDVAYGKTYKSDKIVVDHGNSIGAVCPFTVYGLVGEEWIVLASSTTNSGVKSFPVDNKEISQLKIVYDTSATNGAVPAIISFGINVVGMKTFFVGNRYTAFQTRMAGNGDIAVLGKAYANSNYPALSTENYINDGQKYDSSPVWAPKLEEYSAGGEIYCGVKFDKEYTVNTVVVYAGDVGNKPGNGNAFQLQALVDGQYITIANGFTCVDGDNYMTVYSVDSVKTTDVRIVLTNSSVYIPAILELEIYSASDKVDPFFGHVVSEKLPEVTVFKTETPRFDVAGLPN